MLPSRAPVENVTATETWIIKLNNLLCLWDPSGVWGNGYSPSPIISYTTQWCSGTEVTWHMARFWTVIHEIPIYKSVICELQSPHNAWSVYFEDCDSWFCIGLVKICITSSILVCLLTNIIFSEVHWLKTTTVASEHWKTFPIFDIPKHGSLITWCCYLKMKIKWNLNVLNNVWIFQ